MKKKDVILVAALLVIGLLGLLFMKLRPGETNAQLEILVDGEVYGTYPLSKDQTISIGDTNICKIEGGSVSMTEADCPDHLCMNMPSIDSRGGSIVCLPNKVVLEIISEEDDGVDIIAQ